MLDSAYDIGTPFSLPPFESLGPVSIPQQGQTSPPYCIYPPSNPTTNNPFSPPAFIIPSPPVFHPPVTYPPPAFLPPPHNGETITLWCVAKQSEPDPILQEAMNYACGSGAYCNAIQPNGNCYQPNTVRAHASYAFNSYWQMTKGGGGGGRCEFGGTAMLVTVDPSHDGCHYLIT